MVRNPRIKNPPRERGRARARTESIAATSMIGKFNRSLEAENNIATGNTAAAFIHPSEIIEPEDLDAGEIDLAEIGRIPTDGGIAQNYGSRCWQRPFCPKSVR